MAIKIIEEPDIHITAGELSRYQEEYNRAMMYYAGPRPTLEEWIRAPQSISSLGQMQKLICRTTKTPLSYPGFPENSLNARLTE